MYCGLISQLEGSVDTTKMKLDMCVNDKPSETNKFYGKDCFRSLKVVEVNGSQIIINIKGIRCFNPEQGVA